VKKEHPSAKASHGTNVRSDFIRVAMMGTVYDGKQGAEEDEPIRPIKAGVIK